MSQLQFIGSKITFQAIRDYIFEHKVNRGDSIVLNPLNYEHIVEEIKNSPEGIDIPVNVFGVLLIKDTTDTVETGKIQIVKNESDR